MYGLCLRSLIVGLVNAMSTYVPYLTQIATSVQQTTEDVALKPTAVTQWAASRVPVKMDTLGMDLCVLVSQFDYVLTINFSCLSMSIQVCCVL